MIKLKTVLISVFPRVCQNSGKFYSKATKKMPINSSLSRIKKKTTYTASNGNSLSHFTAADRTPSLLGSVENNKDQIKRSIGNISCKGNQEKKSEKPKPASSTDTGPSGGGYIEDKCEIYDTPKTNSKKWKKISFALMSIVIALAASIFGQGIEHPKRAPYVAYDYLNIHNKRFPWGDGKKSLFHGPNNIIPGEEENGIISDDN